MKFSKEVIDAVWRKARAAADQDSTEWRKDECGAWITYEHYDNEDSEFGWKILNVSGGSPDEPGNLRPFHLENDFNRNTGHAVCRIKANHEATPPTAKLDTPRNMRI